MYNTQMPSKDELPTTKQLLRSTALAAGIAGVLLVTTVLPAEYGIDPTGIGNVLGLTEQGRIKTYLAEEAAADNRGTLLPVDMQIETPAPAAESVAPQSALPVWSQVANLLMPASHAQEAPVAAWKDTTTLTLKPGQGAEVKMTMKKGEAASYEWVVTGGVVNSDEHGDGNGNISYKKQRSVTKDTGVLTAAFDGSHGWFWRNRSEQPVTVTLRTKGTYSAIKRML